jgi:hypothetical protein
MVGGQLERPVRCPGMVARWREPAGLLGPFLRPWSNPRMFARARSTHGDDLRLKDRSISDEAEAALAHEQTQPARCARARTGWSATRSAARAPQRALSFASAIFNSTKLCVLTPFITALLRSPPLRALLPCAACAVRGESGGTGCREDRGSPRTAQAGGAPTARSTVRACAG